MYGTYLGQVYYRGLNEDGSVPDTDSKVSSRVETLEEALNNDFGFDEEESVFFSKVNDAIVEKTVYDTSGQAKEQDIYTIIRNSKASKCLIPKEGNNYSEQTADWSKTITLKATLASISGGELGADLPSYYFLLLYICLVL